MVRTFATLTALGTALLFSAACGGDEAVYEPKPAPSGETANLPPVPALPQKNKMEGDAWTVWGASHDLRSKVDHDKVNNKELTFVGYIVKVNYGEAPECAVHKVGEADPPDCVSPPPSFWIADEKGETVHMMQVMGWASNFAQLYSLIEEIDKAPKGDEKELEIQDEFLVKNLPVPIPNVGAKVKIRGRYGVTSTAMTSGTAADPKYGILTMDSIEYLEPPTELANLPGMKPRKKSIEDMK